MDLWIRSQDKRKLLKCSGVALMLSDCSIYPIGSNGILGSYATKERTLEVLDEIEKLLMPKLKVNTYEIKHAELLNGTTLIKPMIRDIEIQSAISYVYEMPKD